MKNKLVEQKQNKITILTDGDWEARVLPKVSWLQQKALWLLTNARHSAVEKWKYSCGDMAVASVCLGAMADASNPDRVRLNDKLRTPITDLKPMRSIGIVMQSFGESERIGGLRVMFELLNYAFAHFARKAGEVLLRAVGIEKVHVYRLTPNFASVSSLEMNLPSFISRLVSRASFLSAARYAGLNVSMSSMVSSISNARVLETFQPEASATVMSVSSFVRSHAGSFGFASALRKFDGTQRIFNSLSRFLRRLTSASPITTFGRDESITSGRETMFENVLFIVRSVAQGVMEATGACGMQESSKRTP